MKKRPKYLKAAKDLIWVGQREGLLGAMVKEYKYAPVRAMGGVLADLLATVAPELDGRVVVVPLPTVSKHVRARGFDHTLLLARKLARRRGWRCERCLERAKDTVQVGADRETRLAQVRGAYRARGALDAQTTYVLLDDVWTTGASMQEARRVLRAAGAKKIRLMVLAVSE